MKELYQKVFSILSKTDSRPKKRRHKSKGQSLVEIAITLPFLLMLFSSMVEFGFMLNYYLSLLDATRYAARRSANFTPFDVTASLAANPQTPIDNMSFYYDDTNQSGVKWDVLGQLTPQNSNDNTRKTALNPATDNVFISVFSVDSKGTITSYPSSANGGNGTYGIQIYPTSTTVSPGFTKATLQSQLITGAPCEGVLVVEVAYTYHQVLGLPWLAPLGSPVLRAYTVMPLQSAAPGYSTFMPAC